MSPPKAILIVGGTGTLGKELCRQLLASGNSLFILTRHPDNVAQLSQFGMVLVKGDLTDKASLQQACRGMDMVIAAAHALMGRGKNSSAYVDNAGHRDLFDAASMAGVQHIVYMSVVGASPDHPVDFWRTKWKIENYLQASGMSYTIIRSTAFMEIHVRELIGRSIEKKGKVTFLGKGENPNNFVSVKDVARLITMCIENPACVNQTFQIGGPDNIARKEIATLYGQRIKKDIRVSHVPSGIVWMLSKILGPIHPGVKRIMQLSLLMEQADFTFNPEVVLRQFPMKLTGIREFIRDD